MNTCGHEAEWVVTGLAESVDGEPVMVVLGACSRHVLSVKSFLAEWEDVTGEAVIVCGVEAWKAANVEALGEQYQPGLLRALA